jgi:UDP-glucose 4-epimerase
MKRKVLVTGGAGFIGSQIVDALVARGDHVIVYDSLVAKQHHINKNSFFEHADVRDLEKLLKSCEGVDTIFHLAALPRVQHTIDEPHETFQVNVGGTLNVLEAARKAKVRRVIFSSSGAIYGNQEQVPFVETMPEMSQSPYGTHKYIGEKLMHQYAWLYGVETVCLRYFNVYGPRLDPHGAYALVVGAFLRMAKEGKPLTITGDGTQTRDFIHVSDIVRANLLAADSEKVGSGEVLNIGFGKESSVNELAEHFNHPVEYVPARLEPKRALADSSRANSLLDWQPLVALADGIAQLRKEWELA